MKRPKTTTKHIQSLRNFATAVAIYAGHVDEGVDLHALDQQALDLWLYICAVPLEARTQSSVVDAFRRWFLKVNA